MSFNNKAFIDSSVSTAKIIIATVIPYFLLAELLVYFKLMPVIAQIFTPFTALLNLPPEAALALASGIFLNLYAAIAFAAPLGLSHSVRIRKITSVGRSNGLCSLQNSIKFAPLGAHEVVSLCN